MRRSTRKCQLRLNVNMRGATSRHARCLVPAGACCDFLSLLLLPLSSPPFSPHNVRDSGRVRKVSNSQEVVVEKGKRSRQEVEKKAWWAESTEKNSST